MRISCGSLTISAIALVQSALAVGLSWSTFYRPFGTDNGYDHC